MSSIPSLLCGCVRIIALLQAVRTSRTSLVLADGNERGVIIPVGLDSLLEVALVHAVLDRVGSCENKPGKGAVRKNNERGEGVGAVGIRAPVRRPSELNIGAQRPAFTLQAHSG